MDEVLHDWPARSQRSGLVQREKNRTQVCSGVGFGSFVGGFGCGQFSSSASESPNVPPTLSGSCDVCVGGFWGIRGCTPCPF